MAVSGKYGKIDIPKIDEDEPVFILRAQDELAQQMIEAYKELVESHGWSEFADQVQEEIERFKNWKGPRKMPD